MESTSKFHAGIVFVTNSAQDEKISEIENIIGKLLAKIGGIIKDTQIIQDNLDEISNVLLDLCDDKGFRLIITVGGTGLSNQDNTPEATSRVVDKEIPGFSEAMRMETFKITKRAILSRGITGFRGKSMILNLPASPSGVSQCLDVVIDAIPHAISLIDGNVNNCTDD